MNIRLIRILRFIIYLSSQIKIIMNVDFKDMLKLATLGNLGYFIYAQTIQLLQLFKDFQVVKVSDIKTLAQTLDNNSPNDNNQIKLIKLKPYYSQSVKLKTFIRSAQKYKYEPSDEDVINRHFDRSYSMEMFKGKPKLQWFAIKENYKAQDNKVLQYEKIYGLGKVRGDIFQTKKRFYPSKDLNMVQRFMDWIYKNIYGTQGFVQKNQRARLLWFGPVIGVLQYELSLMKNSTIVAVCKLEDGKIIPSITATTKSQILKYYKDTINTKYFAIGFAVLAAIYVGRTLWSDIKKLINSFKVSQHIMKNGHYNEQVAEDKMCIICYSNCRNMVFFDCRHMILCHECSQNYESDVCPYCKMEIDDIKPVNGI